MLDDTKQFRKDQYLIVVFFASQIAIVLQRNCSLSTVLAKGFPIRTKMFNLVSYFSNFFIKSAKACAFTPAVLPNRFKTRYNSGNAQYYNNNPIVYRCVNYISTNAASIGFEFHGDNSSILSDILSQPNPQQTQTEFLEHVFSNYLIYGNVFILFINNPNHPPELRILKTEHLQIIKTNSGIPSGYIYTIDGKQQRLSYESIIHIKTFNPSDYFEGTSCVHAAAKAISHMELFDRKILDKSNWMPSAVFYYQSNLPLTDAKKAELQQSLSDIIDDSSNGRPIILDDKIKFVPLQSPRDEFECINYTNQISIRIAQVFGIPPSLIGLTEPRFSNYHESRKQFWFETVVPIAKKITLSFNNYFSRIFKGIKIQPNHSNIPVFDDS